MEKPVKLPSVNALRNIKAAFKRKIAEEKKRQELNNDIYILSNHLVELRRKRYKVGV